MQAENSKSTQMLNTSSNLLGLCFIVLTSLKVLNLKQTTLIDEFSAIATITFMASSILSFLSIRSRNDKRSNRYENVAEFFFISGLSILFITTMVIAFNII
jgi:hypothetical protein